MIKKILKFFYLWVKHFIREIFIDKESLRIDWHGELNNFGDVLNPLLVEGLTGKKISQVSALTYYKNHFFVIGSILDRATRFTIVWGTGFISETSSCKEVPYKILAVRGPKTRNLLLKHGISCPEVYGDPGLLLSKIYFPKIAKKYKIGIIPHYIDKNHSWIHTCEADENIIVIDIQNKNLYEFINIVLSCEKIASSSLHGIITADAYGIPSTWVEFSNNVAGNGFKFYDYFLSVKRPTNKPLVILNTTTMEEVFSQFYEYKINIDLDKFLKVAPFELNVKQVTNIRKV